MPHATIYATADIHPAEGALVLEELSDAEATRRAEELSIARAEPVLLEDADGLWVVEGHAFHPTSWAAWR